MTIAKSFNIIAISLSIYNYFDVQTKLFSHLYLAKFFSKTVLSAYEWVSFSTEQTRVYVSAELDMNIIQFPLKSLFEIALIANCFSFSGNM